MAWYSNYEHPDKKNSIKDNIFEQRRSFNKQTDAMIKQEKFMNGLAVWIGYWRENPHRFISEYLQISPFSLFQKILIYLMFHVDYFLWWASRGIGKSHLVALYCIVRCILYPGTKICIAAGTKSQSLNVISEKIKGFYDNCPNLQREICELKTAINDPIVRFHNGSWIKVVAANDNARSARANVLVIDEFRMVDNEIIKKVLRKFLTSRRQPGYLKYKEYEGMQEPNTEIYLSSAWYKSHWSWDRFLAFKDAMLLGRRYFTCGFPYQLGVKHGIIDRQRIIDEISESDFDATAFSMEMETLPFGESEKAYFKFEDLNRCRSINKPLIPISNSDYVQFKGDLKKNKFYKPKHKNEFRLLSVDIGLMKGRENDQTVFTFIRCIPNGEEYIKSVEYIETMEGQHTSVQALKLKQLYYDLECDVVAMDTNGNAMGIYDECTKITFDNARGIEYPAFAAFNDEKMQDRAYDKNALPVIYSIKVTGANAAQTNHEMAVYTKTQFEKGRIKLLVNEVEGREYILDNQQSLKLTEEDIARLNACYFQTTRLITEMINLEMEVRSGFIKLTEPAGHRKDRYSSLAYGLYYIKQKEMELRVKEDKSNTLDILLKYSYI